MTSAARTTCLTRLSSFTHPSIPTRTHTRSHYPSARALALRPSSLPTSIHSAYPAGNSDTALARLYPAAARSARSGPAIRTLDPASPAVSAFVLWGKPGRPQNLHRSRPSWAQHGQALRERRERYRVGCEAPGTPLLHPITPSPRDLGKCCVLVAGRIIATSTRNKSHPALAASQYFRSSYRRLPSTSTSLRSPVRVRPVHGLQLLLQTHIRILHWVPSNYYQGSSSPPPPPTPNVHGNTHLNVDPSVLLLLFLLPPPPRRTCPLLVENTRDSCFKNPRWASFCPSDRIEPPRLYPVQERRAIKPFEAHLAPGCSSASGSSQRRDLPGFPAPSSHVHTLAGAILTPPMNDKSPAFHPTHPTSAASGSSPLLYLGSSAFPARLVFSPRQL